MSASSSDRLVLAHRLADAAGEVILPYFRKRIEVSEKKSDHAGDFDPVTEADKGAEKAIRALIEGAFPDDAILGEEFGEKPGASGFCWILDPLDGTRAFIAGQPMWGTLIALEENGNSVFGIIDQPFMKERFVGFGDRAELRSAAGVAPLKTRACSSLAEAVISTTNPLAHFSPEERVLYSEIESEAKLSRYGGDCYGYGLVAMGFVDLVMEAHLRVWDMAALVPIIEGAGGIVTDWQGRPLADHGTILAAGDKRVHADAVALIAAAGS